MVSSEGLSWLGCRVSGPAAIGAFLHFSNLIIAVQHLALGLEQLSGGQRAALGGQGAEPGVLVLVEEHAWFAFYGADAEVGVP